MLGAYKRSDTELSQSEADVSDPLVADDDGSSVPAGNTQVTRAPRRPAKIKSPTAHGELCAASTRIPKRIPMHASHQIPPIHSLVTAGPSSRSTPRSDGVFPPTEGGSSTDYDRGGSDNAVDRERRAPAQRIADVARDEPQRRMHEEVAAMGHEPEQEQDEQAEQRCHPTDN